jgi:hypothetical protein
MCTMSAKKKTPVSASARVYGQELDYLYARRSAIDSLIESLEEYDRFRETRTEDSKRQRA